MREFDVFAEGVDINGKTVVLRSDLDVSRSLIADRVVGPTMAELDRRLGQGERVYMFLSPSLD